MYVMIMFALTTESPTRVHTYPLTYRQTGYPIQHDTYVTIQYGCRAVGTLYQVLRTEVHVQTTVRYSTAYDDT